MQRNQFEFEYNYNNGNFLLISKQEGLKNTDLVELQVKMLQANRIPNLLPINFEEVDYNVKLWFNIESRIILSYYLKTHKITIDEYYLLLIKMVTVLEQCEVYLLEANNFLISEEFIFVGKDLNDIYFTYVPLEEPINSNGVQFELRSLATRLIRALDIVQEDDIQEILNLFIDDSFSVVSFKAKLLKLIDNKSIEVKNTIAETVHYNYHEEVIKATQTDDFVGKKTTNNNNGEIKENYFQKYKISIYSIAFLLIALVWRMYLEYKTEGFLYLSLGLSLLVFDLVYFSQKVNINTLSFTLPSKKTKEAKISKTVQKQKVSNVQNEDIKDHYIALKDKTSLLANKNNETELLKETIEERNNLKSRAFLVSKNGNEKEEVEIIGDSFIIGRNPLSVNYIDKSKGISRIHLEILKTDKGYGVRDLGSKNGSQLNDTELIPNRMYPLIDKDIIRLARNSYEFRII